MASVRKHRLPRSVGRAEECESESLGRLLKRCRARIGPERPSLGAFLRTPMRIGKAVTQEEVAEAVGISRQWYAVMENDRPVRVSARILGRIADTLRMEPAEREALFRLAIPELRSASLGEGSIDVFDAFSPLRRLAQRLWASTTEAEALTVVREYAMTQLRPNLMVARTRVGQGRWEYAGTPDTYSGERVEQLDALIRERGGDAAVDDALCYPLLVQPGELLTRFERPNRAGKDDAELDAVGWTDISFAIANVRTREGLVARLLAVHHTGHAFSKLERAVLSTLADLTSLALSGTTSSRST